MERAVAVLVGGVGVLILTLAGVAWTVPGSGVGGGVEVLALRAAGAPAGGAASGGAAHGGASDEVGRGGATEPLPLAGGSVPAPSMAPPSGPMPPKGGPPTTVADSDPVPPEVLELMAEISGGGIRFEVAQADLDARAHQLLERLAVHLVAEPDLVALVRGHTDSTGTDEFNWPLSVRRAQVVADNLVSLGVAPAQLVTVGLGPSEPVADNATVEGRQANRRAEVVDGRSP